MPPAVGLSDRYDYRTDAVNVQGEMAEKLGIPYAEVQQPSGKASIDRPAHSCAFRNRFTLLCPEKILLSLIQHVLKSAPIEMR